MNFDVQKAQSMALESSLVFNAHEKAFSIGDELTRYAGTVAIGKARCVRLIAGDNLALHLHVEAASAGEVLICQTTSDVPAGYFGEIMAIACIHKKLAGLVMDGTIRDVDALRMIGFPVFAKGVGLVNTSKRHASVPPLDTIQFRNSRVRSGDLIVADGSGVVAVPKQHVAECLACAAKTQEKEKRIIQQIRSGESTRKALQLEATH